jgi:hypothetical protein
MQCPGFPQDAVATLETEATPIAGMPARRATSLLAHRAASLAREEGRFGLTKFGE